MTHAVLIWCKNIKTMSREEYYKLWFQYTFNFWGKIVFLSNSNNKTLLKLGQCVEKVIGGGKKKGVFFVTSRSFLIEKKRQKIVVAIHL